MPGEGRREQGDVDVRSDLAAIPGPVEDHARRGDLGGDEVAAVDLGELLVACHRGDDGGEDGEPAGVAEAAPMPQ